MTVVGVIAKVGNHVSAPRATLGKLGRGDIKVTGASGGVSPNKKENETAAKGDLHTYQDGKEVGNPRRIIRYK